MATSTSVGDGDATVVITCTGTNRTPELEDYKSTEITISTDEINDWDFSSILRHRVVKVNAKRNRLIEHSTYFRALLSGSFSDPFLDFISVHWDQRTFLSLLSFMFGFPVDITSSNFLPLFEGALFFGVEMLLFKCKRWLVEITTSGNTFSSMQLDDLNNIWMFGVDHAIEIIPELCTSYLAKNFMWAMSCNSFCNVPYELLLSCLKHPNLTIDSEKDLSVALLLWVAAKTERSTEDDCSNILKQIRVSLLPLWFVAGKRSCQYFSDFAAEGIKGIFNLLKVRSTRLMDVLGDGNLSNLRIRLTEFTKRIDLSACPQMKPANLLLSVLPLSYGFDRTLSESIKDSYINHERLGENKNQISWELWPTLTFEAVQELDISNCPLLPLEAAIDCFYKSFPSLRMLKAVHFLSFKTRKLLQLVKRCPLLSEIDLTVDVSPVIPTDVPVLSSLPSGMSYMSKPLPSNITKLSLEGRIDFSDSDLQNISDNCVSLCYLNLKACMLLTDAGIAIPIRRCLKLHSIVVCNTSFGQQSILALCSSTPDSKYFLETQNVKNDFPTPAYKLQMLHMGDCKDEIVKVFAGFASGHSFSLRRVNHVIAGIDEVAFSELMSQTYMLKSLCVRESQVTDDCFYNFSGSSLEMLDVSNTKVSATALARIVSRNPGLKRLKTRGCRSMCQQESGIEEGGFYSELGRSCKLEEIAVGWGFSLSSLEALQPALLLLTELTVGLGGSLGLDGLNLLSSLCPALKTLILYFQVISDFIIMNLLVSLKHLELLTLCYCLGEISSLSFNISMPNLRKLRLERVAPWMTNADLVNLTQNCANLLELSLLGCRRLDSESQEIISSGWPGLISIHLEECGEVTQNGVIALFDCLSLEDILLRHNGTGVQNTIVMDIASKLPMVRKVSLDLCDAKHGHFDVPNFADRYFLSIIKIARCGSANSSFDLQMRKARKTAVHKETMVLVWNSEKLTRNVVNERL